MKRTILFLTAVFCLCMTNKTMAYSFSAVNNGQTIYYNITSSTAPLTVAVTYYDLIDIDNNYSGDVVIPSTVTYNSNTYSVTSIGYRAFTYCIDLTSVTIPNSVTSIEEYAFTSCYNLTSITIPDLVTTIGNYAFSACYRLTSITIPNLVSTIGNHAFEDCSYLTSISIPNSVTTIGNWVFSGCVHLTFVTIPILVTSIEDGAFSACSRLISVTIPNSVTSIGENAFSNCSGLTSVTIPDSVTTIGKSAFHNCSSLTSITIPSQVTSIGDGAFAGCSGLTSISVNISNTAYYSISGVLFNKDQTILVCFPAGKTGSYTIPNSVITIRNSAFYGCIGLISVTIPNSVTTIGNSVFSFCSGLTSVSFPNLVTIIGISIFFACNGLTEIYVKAVNPPPISEYTFLDVSTTIPIYVPCGEKTTYQNATYWSDFTNIIDNILFGVTVQSNDTTMGTAYITQANTCANNMAIIEATANAGYRFVQWNDGDTSNPRTITITQDISYTAIFDIANAITDIDISTISIYPNPVMNNINITLPENVYQAVFTLYDMQGKVLICREVSSQETVSVGELAAGIYIYNVITDKQKHVGKLRIKD
ncbi:MAG: leucine-rich repeat domain-containing protein [Bacteroidales bacterium]|jgi:hypothetical protein|nr:leucine-rich repeat domain-containing protein [Bacteroidales bacterium]